jgi:ACR3 family arsenite transporter
MSNLYGNPPCCPDTLPPQAEPDYEAKVQAPELGTAEEEPYVNPIMKLSFIDRYLSMWIILTMVLGVLVGYYSPTAPAALNSVQIINVGLPVAFGLWFMMWPVLVKVKYETFGKILRMKGTWKQISFSMAANWLIGPFIMLACAWAFLPDLPRYRNGVIMVGLARCIAMVLIWNQLAAGDPEYCAILVAINSILQIVLYSPLALFFLVVISNQYGQGTTGDVSALLNKGLNFLDIFESVLMFLGVPLVFALILRVAVIAIAGRAWLEEKFNPRIGLVALCALLWTTFAIFAIQGHNIITNIGSVCRVCVPMVAYFAIMFTSSFIMCRRLNFGYEKSVTQAFTASSNNFELAIAVSAATFGVDSPEALAATIGPLVEVPALLSLVYLALWLKPRLNWDMSSKTDE